MSDNLGPVEVKFTIPSDFGKEADAAIKKMATLTDTAVKMPQDTKAAVLEQKEIIKTITADIKELEKALNNVAPGKAKQEMIAEVQSAKKALAEEEAALRQRAEAQGAASASSQRLMFQIRDMTDQMAKMRVAGQQDTQAYQELENKAANLNQQLQETRQALRSLSDDQRGIKGITEGVSGLTGAFSAGVGAIGLFAGENENLQAIQTKVQSLMAITIGLQQVSNVLDGESAFMTVTVARAKQMWVAAENALTVALWGSNVAAKALMATVTLGLAVAIPLLIGWYDRLNEKQAEAAKIQREAARIQVEASIQAGKARTELDLTIAKLQRFNGSKEAEKKMLKDVNDKYGETFGTYSTLGKWLDVLKSKAADYVRVMFLQAKVGGLIKNMNTYDEKLQVAQNAPLSSFAQAGDGYQNISTPAGIQRQYSADLARKQQESRRKEVIDLNQKWYDNQEREANRYQAEMESIMNKSGINIFTGDDKKGKKDKAEKEKEEKTYYADLLDTYKTYAEKRAEMEEVYNAKIKKLTEDGFTEKAKVATEARDKDLKALDDALPLNKMLEKYKTYDQQIKELTEKTTREITALKAAGYTKEAEMAAAAMSKEVKEIEEQKLKADATWSALFDDMGNITRTKITEIITTTRASMERLRATLSPEEFKILSDLLDKLEEKKAKMSSNEGPSGFEHAATVLGSMVKYADQINAEFGHMVQLTSDVAGNLGNAMESFKIDPQTNKAKNFGSGFGSIINIMMSVGDELDKQLGLQHKIAKQEEARAQYNKNLSNVLIEINAELDDQLAKLDTISGSNKVSAYNDTFSVLSTSIKNAKKQLEEFRFTLANQPKGGNISLDVEQLKFITKAKDEAEAIRRALAAGLISQEQADIANEYISSLEGYQQKIADLKQQEIEFLAQTSAIDFSSQIADAILSAFDAGTDATLAWGNVVDNVFRNAVVNALKLKILEKPINDATEALATAMKDGILTEQEAQAIRNIVEKPAAEFNASVSAALEGLGITSTSSSGSQSGRASFATMKEETGSALLGQFTALRMSSAMVADILEGEKDDRFRMSQHIMNIAENTRQSSQSLKSIDDRLKVFETDGIKVH